jgi:polyhydroxyalkanoate synthesis regulator phasin
MHIFINLSFFSIIVMAEEDYKEVTELDLLYEAHDKVDVLIDLLIEKGVISQEEYENKFEEYMEEVEKEDE